MEINTDMEFQEIDLFKEFKLIHLQWKKQKETAINP